MENDTPNKIKISKEIIATLPIETFPGKIVVIDNERDADNAVLQLNNERIIGFDTETRPTFKKGKSNINMRMFPRFRSAGELLKR